MRSISMDLSVWSYTAEVNQGIQRKLHYDSWRKAHAVKADLEMFADVKRAVRGSLNEIGS